MARGLTGASQWSPFAWLNHQDRLGLDLFDFIGAVALQALVSGVYLYANSVFGDLGHYKQFVAHRAVFGGACALKRAEEHKLTDGDILPHFQHALFAFQHTDLMIDGVVTGMTMTERMPRRCAANATP